MMGLPRTPKGGEGSSKVSLSKENSGINVDKMNINEKSNVSPYKENSDNDVGKQGCHTFLKFLKCSGRKKNVLEV